MSYEDLYYEIHEQMKNLKLKKEFDIELTAIRDEPKWKFKEVRDRWEEARNRTIKKHTKNESI